MMHGPMQTNRTRWHTNTGNMGGNANTGTTMANAGTGTGHENKTKRRRWKERRHFIKRSKRIDLMLPEKILHTGSEKGGNYPSTAAGIRSSII